MLYSATSCGSRLIDWNLPKLQTDSLISKDYSLQ